MGVLMKSSDGHEQFSGASNVDERMGEEDQSKDRQTPLPQAGTIQSSNLVLFKVGGD